MLHAVPSARRPTVRPGAPPQGHDRRAARAREAPARPVRRRRGVDHPLAAPPLRVRHGPPRPAALLASPVAEQPFRPRAIRAAAPTENPLPPALTRDAVARPPADRQAGRPRAGVNRRPAVEANGRFGELQCDEAAPTPPPAAARRRRRPGDRLLPGASLPTVVPRPRHVRRRLGRGPADLRLTAPVVTARLLRTVPPAVGHRRPVPPPVDLR
jgi:hypothetical protein